MALTEVIEEQGDFVERDVETAAVKQEVNIE